MTFGQKLRNLREKKGYGVNQLAVKSGVSSSQISRFENGERKDPTLETVKKLSNALGVSIAYFSEDESSQESAKIETIAAHIDDDVTEEQMNDIINYIDFIKHKHSKKD
ncbi:helix-turn-helix domain-containing protein [Enterococcus italicus]|uniref:helix-turn-helix domain-containing protein n=1 Tax=Enterococcus italicus TaxID=246144 RepID=UPI0028ABEAA3|nr:helix-turn-helix transcriptional regulator [Enterococcus italicus]